MKVLFFDDSPTPYRTQFFDELGTICDLTVIHSSNVEAYRNKEWKENVSEKYFRRIILSKATKDSTFQPKVIKYLSKRKFDIFLISGYGSPTSAFMCEILSFKKIPFIMTVDGGIIKDESKFKLYIKKHLVTRATWWLSTGKNVDNYLKYYGAKEEGIFYYPFTSLCKEDILNEPASVEEKISIKKELNLCYSKLVIAVGRLIKGKGFDVLIRAWSKLNLSNNANLLIVGDGELEEELKQLAMENKCNNIKFIGFKSKKDLVKYYRCSDLFVFPTRSDVWGLVINEAMASGLPVITSDKCIAGLELVKDYENGFIVPADNEEKLAEKIDAILSNDDLCKSMSQISLEKVREYTIENMAKRHMEIFREVLKGDI